MSLLLQLADPIKALRVTPLENATLKSHAESSQQARAASNGYIIAGLLSVGVGILAYHHFSKMRALSPLTTNDPAALDSCLWNRNLAGGYACLSAVGMGYTALFVIIARRHQQADTLAYHHKVMIYELGSLFSPDGEVTQKQVISLLNRFNHRFITKYMTFSFSTERRMSLTGDSFSPRFDTTVSRSITFCPCAEMPVSLLDGLRPLMASKGYQLTNEA